MSLDPYPSISANTLFHFTNDMKNLVGILRNEFRPHYCLEDLNPLFHLDFIEEDRYLFELAIPMVSFCDLPFSQARRHLAMYGDYGIGMTKEWGKRHGISPVLYIYQRSLNTKTISNFLARTIAKDAKKYDELFVFGCFVKPYEGDFWRKSGIIPNVRFYDEREWRYVPVPYTTRTSLFMDKDEFLDHKRRAKKE